MGGYANVLPDFPEALDDFAFLRDQTGYGIDTSVKWIVVGSAADAIVNRELTVPTEQAVLDAADNVAPASEFTINIALDNVTAVFAEDINLEYDSNIFEYVSAEPANSDIQIVKEDASVAGKVRIIAANTGGGISGESTEILKVTFKVKEEIQSATGSISITKADLGTAPDGAVIEAQLSSKTITIGTVVEPDKTELIAAIDYAENIYDSAVVGSQPGQYPQAAKDAFRVAIDAAIAVRDDDNATQEQIDSALADLNDAIQTFKDARIPSEQVNKTALAEAISVAENLFEEAVVGTEVGQYPQEAKDAFGAAIAAAKTVYNDSNATQNQVDDAVTALNMAIDTFKAAEIKEASADINNDGVINVGDLAIVAYYYGKDSTSADWAAAKIADMNGDNKIDILILHMLLPILRNKLKPSGWRDVIFPPFSFIRHQSLWGKEICNKTTKIKVISMFMVHSVFYAAA